jgi:hypothetical protein
MPKKPEPPPLTTSQWAMAFAVAAQELRPEIGLKYAHAVGLNRWSSDHTLAPAEAAKRWVAESKGAR